MAELIPDSGQTKQDIHTDYMDYCALQNKSKSGSSLNNYGIWWMKDLHNAYLLGMTIPKRQDKIRAIRKVATAASATTTTTSNIANNSISSSAISADLSSSTSIN